MKRTITAIAAIVAALAITLLTGCGHNQALIEAINNQTQVLSQQNREIYTAVKENCPPAQATAPGAPSTPTVTQSENGKVTAKDVANAKTTKPKSAKPLTLVEITTKVYALEGKVYQNRHDIGQVDAKLSKVASKAGYSSTGPYDTYEFGNYAKGSSYVHPLMRGEIRRAAEELKAEVEKAKGNDTKLTFGLKFKSYTDRDGTLAQNTTYQNNRSVNCMNAVLAELKKVGITVDEKNIEILGGEESNRDGVTDQIDRYTECEILRSVAQLPAQPTTGQATQQTTPPANNPPKKTPQQPQTP